MYPGGWSAEGRSDLGLIGLKRVVKIMELMTSQQMIPRQESEGTCV